MNENQQNASQPLGVKKGKSTQDAYERIKHLISVNQLAPGQKLIYGDIAKMLNMGVTPVIQALNRLEASGLVRYEANKGYSVGEISEAEVRQLYQAREALEVCIIPDIIKNIDPARLDEISQRFKGKRNLRLSRREMILEDTDFHLAIIRYARNDVIYNLLKGIFEQVYLKYRPEYLDDERVKVITREHNELLQCLKAGDAEKTTALISHHIKTGTEYVVKSIKSEKAWFKTVNDEREEI